MAMSLSKLSHANITRVTRDALMQNSFVIFGLPGTLVDYGRRCSINAFMHVFRDIGVKSVSEHDIKHDIGIDINTHVRKLFTNPGICAEFIKVHTHKPSNEQYNEIAELINSKILTTVDCYSKEIPGASKLTQWLHKQDIKVGVTTEYNMNITERIMNNIDMQGIHIDEYVVSDEVRIGRPEPWQAHMLMRKMGFTTNVSNSNSSIDAHGIKIGDTVADIIEGQKLGFTTCNVTISSGEMGFNKTELSYLPREFVNYRNLEIRRLWETYNCNMYVTDMEELAQIWCSNK